MDFEEYIGLEDELKKEHNSKIKVLEINYQERLHNLRNFYVAKNHQFQIDDFVGNITGIIKVDMISYEIFRDELDIVYKGLRYRKEHGEYYRTKDRKVYSFREMLCLKK